MKKLVFSAVAMLAILHLGMTAQGAVLMYHEGQADPETEGWQRTSNGGTAQGVSNGKNAWQIETPSPVADVFYYSHKYTVAEQAALEANGYYLSAELDVISSDGIGSSMLTLVPINGNFYNVYIWESEDGDPVTQWHGTSPIEIDGAGSGYHTYTIEMLPGSLEATLYVDGVEISKRISTQNWGMIPGVMWGDNGTYAGNGITNFSMAYLGSEPVPDTPVVPNAPKPPGYNFQLVDSQRIWADAPHSAFTSLVRFQDRWYCSFREGSTHKSYDGKIRVLTSVDGVQWTSAALLNPNSLGLVPEEYGFDDGVIDLRDPSLTVTPDDELLLTTVLYGTDGVPQDYVSSIATFSQDGFNWSDGVGIGDPDVWLWEMTKHQNVIYSAGYILNAQNAVRLYRSDDGHQFDVLVENILPSWAQGGAGYGETGLVFTDDGTAYCVVRQEGNSLYGCSRSRPCP